MNSRPAGPLVAVGRLRRRLVLAFATVATIGFVALGIGLMTIDTVARTRELDERLQGFAARAAALVYVEDHKARTDAVVDDAVDQEAPTLIIYGIQDGDRAVALVSKPKNVAAAFSPLAAAAAHDSEERGTRRTVAIGTTTWRAVGLPWFDGSHTAGAVVVAAPTPTPLTSPLLAPVVAGGVLLDAILIAVASLAVRRGFRSAETAIDERDQFVAMAAHEMRGPITRIRAAVETLLRTTERTDSDRLALQALVQITDNAGRMVANLLLAARIDHDTLSPQDDVVRLDQLAAEMEFVARDVVVDITGPVTIRGDGSLIRHALSNLVENASRHARVDGRALLVTVQVEQRAGSASVSVEDNGPGLPDGVDVVRPFVSVGSGGSGLGLALTAWIAEQHHAVLRLHRLAPGTRVEIEFPAPFPIANPQRRSWIP